jgi:hypothetical protein
MRLELIYAAWKAAAQPMSQTRDLLVLECCIEQQ